MFWANCLFDFKAPIQNVDNINFIYDKLCYARVLAKNSDSLIPSIFEPNVVDLIYFKP